MKQAFGYSGVADDTVSIACRVIGSFGVDRLLLAPSTVLSAASKSALRSLVFGASEMDDSGFYFDTDPSIVCVARLVRELAGYHDSLRSRVNTQQYSNRSKIAKWNHACDGKTSRALGRRNT
jgi:hypothetical protein